MTVARIEDGGRARVTGGGDRRMGLLGFGETGPPVVAAAFK
jgi:hypothetical protein